MSSDKPQWIKKRKGYNYFFDGDLIAVTLKVKNEKTGHSYWDVYRLQVSCDEDYFQLQHADSGEYFDEWQWEDVEYYMVIDGHGPMTKKTLEAMV